jgi:tripeptidyl-peptidase-1
MLTFFTTRSALLALCLAAGEAFAAPTPNHATYAVKESHPVPSKWENIGKAPGDHVINLQIAVKQSRFDELEKHLLEGETIPSFSIAQCHAAP